MQGVDISGKAIQQRLILRGLRLILDIRFAIRNHDRIFGCVFAAEPPVKPGKQGNDTGEQLLAVGMISIALADDNGAFIALVVNVRNLALAFQAPFDGNRIMKN